MQRLERLLSLRSCIVKRGCSNACTYGGMDEMDKAIEYLKLAFERKENMIAGEKMPNPANDSSFERFINNERFLTALKEIEHK